MSTREIKVIAQPGAREVFATDEDGTTLRLVEQEGRTYVELIYRREEMEFIESAGPFDVGTVATLRDWALEVAPRARQKVSDPLGAILLAIGPVVWLLTDSWAATWRITLAFLLAAGVATYILDRGAEG